MNTPTEHTEHRTDKDPLKGTGPAFARFPPREVPRTAATTDPAAAGTDGLGSE